MQQYVNQLLRCQKYHIPISNLNTENSCANLHTILNEVAQLLRIFDTWQSRRSELMLQSDGRKLGISLCKEDLSQITELHGYLQRIVTNTQFEANEYARLQIVCRNTNLDYETLLKTLLESREKPSALAQLFNQKERGFVYAFLSIYAELKVQAIKAEQEAFTESQNLLAAIRTMIIEVCQLRVSNLPERALLNIGQNNHYLEQILHLVHDFKVACEDCLGPLPTQLRAYSAIQVRMRLNGNEFHDYLIKELCQQVNEMIQVNIVRDLKLQQYFQALLRNALKVLGQLCEKADLNLRAVLFDIDPNSKDQLGLMLRAEEKWDLMLKDQQLLLETQLPTLSPLLVRRKQEYMAKRERYIYNTNNDRVQLTVPLSAREVFRTYYGDEQNNFYFKFKSEQLKQKDIQFTKYDHRPPTLYEVDECQDLQSILDCPQLRRTMHYKHPIKERIMYFVPDYVQCRQEDVVYFLDEKEFIIECEVFMSQFLYSDHFTIRQFIYVQQSEPHVSILTYGFSKHIVRQTIFESLLEHKSKQENTTTWETLLKPAMIRAAQDYALRRHDMLETRKKDFIYKGILHQEESESPKTEPLVIIATPPRKANKRMSQEQFVKIMALMILVMAIMSRY